MTIALAELCNIALNWCRAENIADPDEASVSANACRRFYSVARDAVLRAYPWNCSAGRAQLAAGRPPAFEWAASYRLPDDCVMVRELADDPNADYVVEGRYLLCNLTAPLNIRYSRSLPVEEMDPLLVAVVAARLAYDMSPSLTESAAATAGLLDRYHLALDEAQKVDAREGAALQPGKSFSWIDARYF